MRVPLPGPRDVRHLVERAAQAGEQVLATVPAISRLLDEAGVLLARTNALVDGVEETRSAVNDVVQRTQRVVAEAELLVAQVGPLTDRVSLLWDSIEPSLVALQPTLERLAETTDPAEVDALVSLVDHLPVLAAKMETDVIPVLESLSTVSPDLHELLEVSRELNEILASLPGLGRVKRRIDESAERSGDA